MCDSNAQFNVHIKTIGTAIRAEWVSFDTHYTNKMCGCITVQSCKTCQMHSLLLCDLQICSNGHSLWTWCTQPKLKFGMQAGDFLLSSNILLSGNNYEKVSLLFKFMNMGMVNRTTFFTIQDTYCVKSIKDFWTEKRSEAIIGLQGKEVVLLGVCLQCDHTDCITEKTVNIHGSINSLCVLSDRRWPE